MQIIAKDLGKRYNREWIFRHFNYTFAAGNAYAITGANGSGKSTLLQVLAGAVLQNEGRIVLTSEEKIIEEPYAFLSITAPYLELIEELTAKEILNFHSTFKKLIKPVEDILDEVGLSAAKNKQARYFSSGMKQRLKMAQAFFSDTPILLLDEPTTNLDKDGIALYLHLINEYSKKKLVIISSNDPGEYNFCGKEIKIEDYKVI